MSELILLRSHFFSSELDRLGTALEEYSGANVSFVVDEQKGEVRVASHFKKIVLTNHFYEDLGLFCPLDYAWRCGDYIFYKALYEFPETQFFWLIEHDVRIHVVNPAHFFARYRDREDLDFLCFDYSDAGSDWYWTQYISPFFSRPKKCLFPIVRASRKAIELCLANRKKLTTHFSLRNGAEYPNDESFMASTIGAEGLKGLCLRLEGWGDETQFRFRKPFSLKYLEASPPDGRIYHPVLEGRRFAGKALVSLLTLHAGPEVDQYIAYLEKVLPIEDPSSLATFNSYKEVALLPKPIPLQGSRKVTDISTLNLTTVRYTDTEVTFAILGNLCVA